MLYKECQPSVALFPYVETYWTAVGYCSHLSSDRILPDGCIDIIFTFGDRSEYNTLTPFQPNIVGTMTSYADVLYHKSVSMLGIRFRPAGLTAFTKVSMSHFTDQSIDATCTESIFDDEFYARLPDLELMDEKLKHIDSYLVRMLKYVFDIDRQTAYAVELVRKTGGLLSLEKVAESSCLSLRHLERKFSLAIGVTPKMFSRIVKLNHAISYLKDNSEESISSVAIACGYYDHSHFIKEFNMFTGDSPSHFSK